MDHAARERTRTALDAYLRTPIDALLHAHAALDPDAHALALFHDVARAVPAYGAFLREHGVDPASVRTPNDFRALPLVTRENYVARYPLPERCRGGELARCDMVAVSSGSSGEPTVWPRALADELAVAARFEQVFVDNFRADEARTLAVVCFPLGTWVGGMFTAACCRHLAAKGYAITVATPGNSKLEIYRVLRALAPHFERVVLLGYPPFLKDVIDGGPDAGLDWRALDLGLVGAGEVFSEEWRALVGERAGLRRPLHDVASLYGTADAGVLATETPLSVAVRRFLAANLDVAEELFGERRLPTLAQYDPCSRYFEARAGTLLFTGDNGVPLVRYHIADQGGLYSHDALLAKLAARGFDPRAEVARHGGRGARALPFVYVFGRTLFAVSFYGANVYPENVAPGLEQLEVAAWVTGRFVMQVREDAGRDAHLAIAVELAPGVAPGGGTREAVALAIRAQLERVNSEFRSYVPEARRKPEVDLRAPNDPEYFPLGVKHRYTRPPR